MPFCSYRVVFWFLAPLSLSLSLSHSVHFANRTNLSNTGSSIDRMLLDLLHWRPCSQHLVSERWRFFVPLPAAISTCTAFGFSAQRSVFCTAFDFRHFLKKRRRKEEERELEPHRVRSSLRVSVLWSCGCNRSRWAPCTTTTRSCFTRLNGNWTGHWTLFAARRNHSLQIGLQTTLGSCRIIKSVFNSTKTTVGSHSEQDLRFSEINTTCVRTRLEQHRVG